MEAAAAAAAAPKPKPAPAAAKPKEPKQAAASGAMPLRQPGVPVLSLQNVASALPTVKLHHANGGADARPYGNIAAGLAVQRNEAMAPERVVRHRAIPGWTGPEAGKVAKAGNALEQQRAMVAELKAEAKAAAGRGTAKAAAAAAAANARGAAAGGGGARPAADRRNPNAAHYAEDSDSRSDDSGPHPPAPPPRDFALASEDFPSFPGAGRRPAPPPPARQPDSELHPAFNCPMPTPFDAPQPRPASADAAEVEGAGAEEQEEEDADPVVARDQVFALEDGTVVVADAYGNYVRMEEVYGAEPELMGYQDEVGGLSYFVVIRASHMVAHEAHLEALAAEHRAAEALAAQQEEQQRQAAQQALAQQQAQQQAQQALAAQQQQALAQQQQAQQQAAQQAAQALAQQQLAAQQALAQQQQQQQQQQQLLQAAGSGVDAAVLMMASGPASPSPAGAGGGAASSGGGTPSWASPDGKRASDQGSIVFGVPMPDELVHAKALKGLLAAAAGQQQQQPELHPPVGADGEDLDDLLALCMCGGEPAAADYGDVGGGAAAAAAAAAPAGPQLGCAADVQQPEGEDLDDLLSLLCV